MKKKFGIRILLLLSLITGSSQGSATQSKSINTDLTNIPEAIIDYYNQIEVSSLHLEPSWPEMTKKLAPEKDIKLRRSFRLLSSLFRNLIFPIMGVSVTGAEMLPKDVPYLLLFNHPTIIEPVLIAFALKEPVVFMVDSGCFDQKLLKKIFTHFKAIRVVRSTKGSNVGSIKAALRSLKGGNAVALAVDKARTTNGLVGMPRKITVSGQQVLPDQNFLPIDTSSYNLAKKTQVSVLLTSVAFKKRWFYTVVKALPIIPDTAGFKTFIHFHKLVAPPAKSSSPEQLEAYAAKCRDRINLSCLMMNNLIDK